MRSVAKAAVERLLLTAGPAAVSRRTHRGRGMVLAYHNVVPDGEAAVGEPSLHLVQRRFANQLDLLAEGQVEVVSLDALMDSADRAEPHSTRRVAITFDDAYRGAVAAGVEELVRRDLPATIFVVPGLLGDQTFWWDALSANDAGLSSAVRDAALYEMKGRNEAVVHWAHRYGLPVGAVPEHARSATDTELATAAAHGGITLGSHTWSHPNLARLSEEECKAELTRAAAWLRRQFGDEPRWVSYPYGLYGTEAVGAASAAGHQGAFRIEGGWIPRSLEHRDTFRLPRVNVPAGLSRDGFVLRLAGLLCR